MLVVRERQMEALRAAGRAQLRVRLLFLLSATAGCPALEVLGPQVDAGMAEAARLGIAQERDIAAFISALWQHVGLIPVGAPMTYPAGAARLLGARGVPAAERVRSFAAWCAADGARRAA